MKRIALPIFLLLTAPTHGLPATPDLSGITSRADLEKTIAATSDGTLKAALSSNADAILTATERYPHVQAVIQTIESSPGKFEKINTTPDALKQAAGGELPVFDTLTLVSTGILNGKAHAHREAGADPYDAAFIEHLGHIPTLESAKIVAMGIQENWLSPLLKLRNLKSLSIEGRARLGDASLAELSQLKEFPHLTQLELAYFGKATDAGLEQLAGLTQLESFAFRGCSVPGHGFAKFEGWTRLKSINFHSNGLDDEGLGYVCERFPNLEFIKLWHSHAITDASAAHLGKLGKLKGIEISCDKATAGLFKDVGNIPLEYAALEYGVNSPAPEIIAAVASLPTLRRLKIQAESYTVADLMALAGVKQIEELSLSNLPLTDERVAVLKNFAFLKALELIDRKRGYPETIQAKVRETLPGVTVTFVN
ncbi:MAG: G protein-coupled receptor LGR4 [Verrucomicrobiae bacterium]|nr:G protein-coupled receptor LGR4 [Verrucomicrobiae bacterium]